MRLSLVLFRYVGSNVALRR